MPADPGHDEGFFGERVASVYDEHAAALVDPAVVTPVVDLLAGLAGRGAALELGVGTGRVVVETGVPDLQNLPVGQTIIPFRADPGGIGFDVYDVVTQRFAALGGIKRTHTLVAFEVFSQHDLEALFSIGS